MRSWMQQYAHVAAASVVGEPRVGVGVVHRVDGESTVSRCGGSVARVASLLEQSYMRAKTSHRKVRQLSQTTFNCMRGVNVCARTENERQTIKRTVTTNWEWCIIHNSSTTCLTSLPDAMADEHPHSTMASTARLTASDLPPPRERLVTHLLPFVLWSLHTHSMPLITPANEPDPNLVVGWRESVRVSE